MKASRNAAVFSCCERGSFEAASNIRRILSSTHAPVPQASIGAELERSQGVALGNWKAGAGGRET
jgi:hypothetical protein